MRAAPMMYTCTSWVLFVSEYFFEEFSHQGNGGREKEHHTDGGDAPGSFGQYGNDKTKDIQPIAKDAEVVVFREILFDELVDQEGKCIIGCHALAGLHVKGCGCDEHDECGNKHSDLYAGRKDGGKIPHVMQKPGNEIRNVADEDHVGDGAKTKQLMMEKDLQKDHQYQEDGIEQKLVVAEGPSEDAADAVVHGAAGIGSPADIV